MSYNLRKRTIQQQSSDTESIHDEYSDSQSDTSSIYDTQYTQRNVSYNTQHNNTHSMSKFEEYICNRIYERCSMYMPRKKARVISMQLIGEIGNYFEEGHDATSDESQCSESECDTASNDVDRYINIISKTIPQRHVKLFKKLMREIEEDKPTVVKILDANLSASKKKELLQEYIHMLSTENGSILHYELESQISKVLNSVKNVTQEMLKEEERLDRLVNNNSNELLKRIVELKAPDSIKTAIYEKYKAYIDIDRDTSTKDSIKKWLDWALHIPYTVQNKDIMSYYDASNDEVCKFMSHVKQHLDDHILGCDEVKQKILYSINNKIRSKGRSTVSIALAGPPGVGKTSIAKVTAEALGIPFERISLGGASDASLLTGSAGVWIGSEPSIIVKVLKRMKCNNGIILFDEMDKLANTEHGKAVQNALMHITDYSQNNEFRDMFLSELNIDISKLWFIYSFNDEKLIDPILRDRLSIITLKAYTEREKVDILYKIKLKEICSELGIEVPNIPKEWIVKLVRHIDSGGVVPGMRAFNDKLRHILEKLSYENTVYGKPIQVNNEVIYDVMPVTREVSYIS